MSPTVNGSQTFSSCSLTQMATTIATRAASYPSCLVQLYDLDAGVIAPTSLSVAPGADLDITVTVRNLGTQELANLRWEFVTPTGLNVVSLIAAPGACTHSTSRADCTLDTLEAEASWRATMRVRSEETGRYSVTTRVTVAGDQRASNDTASFSVTVSDPNAPGSAGGGGGLDALTVLALLLAGAAQAGLRRPGRESHRAACHSGKLRDDLKESSR
jgi:hypothetical protein